MFLFKFLALLFFSNIISKKFIFKDKSTFNFFPIHIILGLSLLTLLYVFSKFINFNFNFIITGLFILLLFNIKKEDLIIKLNFRERK